MKVLLRLLSFAVAAAGLSAVGISAPVYELRTYTAAPGRGADVVARFREHTTRIFERHGMVNVGYWVAADAKDGGGDRLVYLLSHQSRDAAKASWKAFSADPEWKDVAKRTTASGQIVSKVESVFLESADSRGRWIRAMARVVRGSSNCAPTPPRRVSLPGWMPGSATTRSGSSRGTA
jgi:hypothetical protein